MKQAVRFFLTGIFFFCLFNYSSGQSADVGLGQWRIYQPNMNARMVADAGNRIYCVTDAGFFYVDKEFSSTKTLSKLDGLHDIGVETINYDSLTKTLVVAYKNANLDLIREDQVININDILRKSIPGDKTINHVYFKDKLAYLSCGFGLVILDLVKLEIRDTYIFRSANGTNLKVYASTTLNDRIFITTSNGVMSASNKRTVNLNDPQNWITYTAAAGLPPAHPENFRYLVTFQNAVYLGINRSGLYKLNGNTWAGILSMGQDMRHINVGKSGVLVSNEHNLLVYHPDRPAIEINGNSARQDYLTVIWSALQTRSGEYWIADLANGLVKFDGTRYELYVPNGPASALTFNLYADDQSLIVLGGGYTTAIQNNSEIGFYEFKNGTWENFNYKRFNDTALFYPTNDLVDAARSPVTGKLYLASFGYGLIEWSGPGAYKIYDVRNSPLQSAVLLPDQNHYRFVQVTDLTFDADGDLWLANPSRIAGQPSLHVLRTTGAWETFTLQNTPEGTSFNGYEHLARIVIDDNGYKWMTFRPGSSQRGVVVFDDKKNRFRHYTSGETTGDLPSDQVNCLTKDMNGEIWVGTVNGIGVFTNPDQAFTASLKAHIPVIERRALLEGQAVNVITVDGANRKWVGTDNGVWLFNKDGDEVVYHFTTDNSPLPSNKITSIAVNNTSGDVFIGTEGGLASFRAGATITPENLNCANVFPNPVRPGYSGQIGISGLANNGTVKITDLAGQLVYELKATGGTAIWNGKDYSGKKVRTGVYLVLSSNAEGEQTCISKVAVVE